MIEVEKQIEKWLKSPTSHFENKQNRSHYRKRGRMETIYDILCSASGVKKTTLMYKTNLSHSQIKKYIKLLIDRDLIYKKNDAFFVTNKGKEFIKKFEEFLIIKEDDRDRELFMEVNES